MLTWRRIIRIINNNSKKVCIAKHENKKYKYYYLSQILELMYLKTNKSKLIRLNW